MDKSKKPLPHHFNDFLDWLEIERGLSSKSQENYSRFLKKFFDWLEKNNLSNLLPHQLSPTHIRQYRVYLARQESAATHQFLKKTTQNYYLIALRSLLNFFADRDILSLPAEKIKLPKKKDSRKVDFLTVEQIEKLFEAPDISTPWGLRDRTILESFFSTGMRLAELSGLNREQFKIKPETVSLEIVIIGKGNKPRPVYFSRNGVNWLRKYLEARESYLKKSKNVQEKALFINFKNKKSESLRLSHRAIQRFIKRYAILSGVPLTLTPHVMRHSFATYMLSKGVDIRTLQEFLGHKSITATQIYAHVTNKRLRDIHHGIYDAKK